MHSVLCTEPTVIASKIRSHIGAVPSAAAVNTAPIPVLVN